MFKNEEPKDGYNQDMPLFTKLCLPHKRFPHNEAAFGVNFE